MAARLNVTLASERRPRSSAIGSISASTVSARSVSGPGTLAGPASATRCSVILGLGVKLITGSPANVKARPVAFCTAVVSA